MAPRKWKFNLIDKEVSDLSIYKNQCKELPLPIGYDSNFNLV
jgi:hypothetical protein